MFKTTKNFIYSWKVVNIYIIYELGASSSHNNDPTLKNCLFGAVTLTKYADIDKYGYSGYEIGFDRRSSFSFPEVGFGQNVIHFGADRSSSAHIDNKKKDILVLRKGPTHGLEHSLIAEKIIRLILLWQKRNFVWACITLEQIVICLSMVQKFTNSEIVANPLCLGNISKDWSTDNMKKNRV